VSNDWVNDELEGVWKELVAICTRYFLVICLKGQVNVENTSSG
jgi:hypothetical protein